MERSEKVDEAMFAAGCLFVLVSLVQQREGQRDIGTQVVDLMDS